MCIKTFLVKLTSSDLKWSRTLYIYLLYCTVHLELSWIEDCILSSAGDSAKFKITDAKLLVLKVHVL